MAARKDNALRFVEETTKYTRAVTEMSKSSNTKLNDDMVQSLLTLVKGIDQLLTRQDVGPEERSVQPTNKQPLKKPGKDKKQKGAAEFDVGILLPKNFNTSLPELNEKNCPGLTEKRSDFKITEAKEKKKK